MATLEGISYRSIENPYCVTFLGSIIDTCVFLTIAVFSLNKSSIKERIKQIQDFLFFKRTLIYASTCDFKKLILNIRTRTRKMYFHMLK